MADEDAAKRICRLFAAAEGILQLVPKNTHKKTKGVTVVKKSQNKWHAAGAWGGRSCGAPEVEKSLHGERGDAGGDDCKGQVGAVGNENVVWPGVRQQRDGVAGPTNKREEMAGKMGREIHPKSHGVKRMKTLVRERRPGGV